MPGRIEVKALLCTIIISSMADPATEPEFKVIMDGDSVSINQTVTLLVASTKELSWDSTGATSLQTGLDYKIKIQVTNIGNTLVSGALSISSNDNLPATIDGDDTINLQAGQSEEIEVIVSPTKSGNHEIIFYVSGSNDVQNPDYLIAFDVEGESVVEKSESVSPLIISLSIIIPLILIIAFVLVIRNRNQSSQVEQLGSSNLTRATNQTAVIPCFSCRQPILTEMVGCPSCGARYHSTCSVPNCLNCGADSSHFIKA